MVSNQLVLSLLTVAGAFGQVTATVTFPARILVHPKSTFQTIVTSNDDVAASVAAMESANIIDYITTKRGAFPGTGGCELNPLLVKAPCQINVPRFTGIKVGVAALGSVELLGLRVFRGPTYRQIVVFTNYTLTVVLGGADTNNIHQLTK